MIEVQPEQIHHLIHEAVEEKDCRQSRLRHALQRRTVEMQQYGSQLCNCVLEDVGRNVQDMDGVMEAEEDTVAGFDGGRQMWGT